MSGLFGKMRFGRQDRLENMLFFCFLAGLLAGTATADFCFSSFGEEAVHYLGLLKQNADLGGPERMQVFSKVLRQRLTEVLVICFTGLTVYAVPGFCLISCGAGFSMGLALSILTGQKGLMGLPVFLMTIMPQAFCYLSIWVILLYWLKRRERRLKLMAFLLLLCLAVLGSFCEAWLNPWLLAMVL